VRPRPTPRTALLGALVSAGVVGAMLATSAVHAAGPPPAASVTVQVRPQGPAASFQR
jgi:hypothetical protein